MVRKVFIVLLLCYGTAFAQQKKPALAPFFKGNAFPTPPMQKAPWPNDDNALSNAAATLFAQGLADPRGLEYREIEIAVGSPWNGGGYPFKTHGWILPKKSNSGQFAVAWNGLIYPVLQVGAAADVDKDWTAVSPQMQSSGWDMPIAFESFSVSIGHPTEIERALLLRLGKGGIVKRIYKLLPEEADDPYLDFVNDWAWFAFERAVCAHERGDDHLALIDARMLTKIQPLIRVEAKRRGFKSPHTNSPLPVDEQPYLPFLTQLPELLKDSERRVTQENNPPVPQNQDGIPALIYDLQNVDARQWGQPGGVSLAQDKRIQALVKRGDAIVAPILNTMENDTRLTRSVSFGRDFARDRHLIPVSQAAYAAIEDLLQVGFKPYNEKDGNRKQLSKEEFISKIRDYWDKMKALSPNERFYTTLKNDKASTDQWLQAAANIVQPTDVQTHGSWISEPNRKAGQQITLRGESLRDGRVPSVSDLLAERSDDIAATDSSSSTYHFVFLDAAQVALDLSSWDKPAAIPILQKRLTTAMNFHPQPDEHVLMMTAKMTDALARCGDETAYDNYAAWIEKVDLKNVSYGSEELQKTLIAGAARPSIKQATDYLFNDPQSPWSQALYESTFNWIEETWKTSLPMTAGFRKKALRMLKDKNFAGTITFHPREDLNSAANAAIKIKNITFGYYGTKDDTDTPAADEERSFRVCDAYAYFFSLYQNGPKIQLFWPVEKRDASVAACRKWLEGQK